MIIENDNFALDVDIKATAEYYKTNSVCDCADCRNFQLQAKQKFPVLTQILAELGVDICRPDESAAYDEENVIYYDFVAYTVLGKILQANEYVFYIMDFDTLLKMVINNRYIPNSQQTETYFTVTVTDFQLDWKLNELYPIHKPYSVQSYKKRFIHKIKNLFTARKSSKLSPSAEIQDLPKWEKIVEMMYDAQLDVFDDEVVRVIYSADRTRRYVILKDEKGLYTYQLEAIYQFDKDEWKYICSEKNTLPAMWEPFHSLLGSSIFATEEDLLREMQLEPEYKQYFS